jgi:nucleoid DNA-binding protein
MPKITKKVLEAAIVEKTGVKTAAAKRALETVLASIKIALAEGRKVDLGKLGRLSVAARPLKHRINGNLKHVRRTVERLHHRHPKTVRLTKRQDLSENPLPTKVHTNPEPTPTRRVRVAVAIPSWRRRIN